MESDPPQCARCFAVLPPEAKVCGECGLPRALATTSSAPAPSPAKWHHNIWVLLGLIVFVLGPLALPMVWRNPRLSTSAKLMLTAATLLYTFWLIDATIRATRAVLGSVDAMNTLFKPY